MGISEENVEKIIADYGSAVQREQAKAAELKAKADSADELQKKLDEMEAGNLTELEKANKALETANQQIAECVLADDDGAHRADELVDAVVDFRVEMVGTAAEHDHG